MYRYLNLKLGLARPFTIAHRMLIFGTLSAADQRAALRVNNVCLCEQVVTFENTARQLNN